MWIVKNYVWRKSLDDPFVLQAFIRRESLLGIPLKASTNEIYEGRIWQLSQLAHDVAESFFFLIVCEDLKRCRDCVVFELGKELLPLRILEDLLGWHSDYIYDELKLLGLLGAGEERESGVQLNHDASETPHVDLLCVGEETQDDIRCSVETTLNVGVDDFMLKTPTAEIGHHNTALVLPLEQDVFWLQITMNNTQVLHVSQRG